MSLVIDIPIPNACCHCVMAKGYGCGAIGRVMTTNEMADLRPEWCPITAEIPIIHGRLIDADALIKSLEVDPVECPGCPEPEYLGELIELLREAPTIIEAEEL